LSGVIERNLTNNSSISDEKVKTWSVQILDGLDFLHTKGVIHLDIKPSNIFLDELERIKLGDLGIARNFQSLSTKPSFLGTILYMSPELVKEEKFDFKADIWSFGCVLYEMITLRALFGNQPLYEIVKNILNSKTVIIPLNAEPNLAYVLEK
jgi:serine/threonine protein kinase